MSWGNKASVIVRGLSAVCLGAAVVLLLWAAGLALWSWRAPAPLPTPVESASYRASQVWSEASTNRIIWWVCAAAVVMLTTLAIMWWKRTARISMVGVLAVVLMLIFMLPAGTGLQDFYHRIQEQPVTMKWPVAVAGWWMAVAGVAVTIFAVPAVASLSRKSWWFVGVGAVTALVLTGSVTTAAVRAGDDGNFIDATTAAAVDVPAIPDRLGQQIFTMRIADDTFADGENPPWQVVQAGAGFVTFGDGLVAAYGSDGAERWHYRRSGPGRIAVSDMAVFDHGDTVIVRFGGTPMMMGLDAMTGRELWRSSDPDLADALLHAQGHGEPPEYLLSTNKNSLEWTRYDTRSGSPMWTVPAPSTECDGWYGGMPTIPSSAYRCVTDNIADVRFVDIDPESGRIRWKTTLSAGHPLSDREFWRPSVYRTGLDGAVVRAEYEANRDTSVFVNLKARETRDLGGAVYVYWTRDDSEDFLATGPRPSQDFRLRGPDGEIRCTFPEDPRTNIFEARALILGNEVVFADDQLKVFNRSDCARAEVRTAPGRARQMVAASGVVLVVRTDDTGTYVDGYH